MAHNRGNGRKGEQVYTAKNYKTKKAMVADIDAGVSVRVYQPGPFPGTVNGVDCLEGPHYPEPHRWYARVFIVDGCAIRLAKKGE